MSYARVCVALAMLALAGCSRWPDSYSPPEQRTPIIRRHVTMLEMSDPAVSDYIVKDIAPRLDDGFWRWTFDRPELEFWLNGAANRRAAMEFVIVRDTLKQTGPVTVTLFVNGHEAIARRYEAPGRYRLETSVPPGWIESPGNNTIAAESRPIWVAPGDQQHLGIMLIRAGFL